MIDLIFLFIFIASISVMAVILFKKMPVLVELPDVPSVKSDIGYIFFNSVKKIKDITLLRNFSTEAFLQKILSKIRILTLKIEGKTSSWLQKLREKSQKRKLAESDDYWKKVKKLTNLGSKNKKSDIKPV